MDKYGIKRYIHIGGVAHKGGKNEDWSFSRQILVAKHLEWEVLKASDLDWTLVRPPRIAN